MGQGNIFTPVCHSVHRGGVRGCSRGGMHGCSGGGHAWLLRGGMHGCSGGVCMAAVGGYAWLLPGGHAWLLQGGMHGCSRGGIRGIWRDTEIRSMSGRYASYWNAFLLLLDSVKTFKENPNGYKTPRNLRERPSFTLFLLLVVTLHCHCLQLRLRPPNTHQCPMTVKKLRLISFWFFQFGVKAFQVEINSSIL